MIYRVKNRLFFFNQILESAYMKALESVVLPATSKISYANDFVSGQASMIKNTSWRKINEILSTQYGNAVVHGVDNTVACVDELLDKYFPPICEENFPGTRLAIS